MKIPVSKILKSKKREIQNLRRSFPPEVIKAGAYSVGGEFRSVEYALHTAKHFPVLVELKSRLFPEKDVLEDLQPLRMARALSTAGLEAGIIVATDSPFLGGDPGWVNLIKMHTELPVLQLDFFLHPDQMYQSKAIGADAVILDGRFLSPKELVEMSERAAGMGMEIFLRLNNETGVNDELADSLTGVIVDIVRGTNGVPDLAPVETLRKNIPEETILLGRGNPQNKTELKDLRNAGVQALILDNGFWRQAENVLDAYKKIIDWI